MRCNKYFTLILLQFVIYVCVWTSWAHIYEYLVLLCKIGCDNHVKCKLLTYIKVTNTYMLEARNDVEKARLFGCTCSTCCAGDSWSPSTSSTVAGPWCSTPPPLVLRVVVVDDVGLIGTEEPPCSIDSSCLLLFRGMSRKMSASSVSSSDKVKIT